MELLPPPGPARRRQLVQLVVLLAVLAGIIRFMAIPAFRTGPTSNPAAGPAAAASTGELPVPDALKLDALRDAGEATDAGRNPFVFGQRDEPSMPGSAFVLPPQAAVPAGPPPPPPPPPGPPVIPLRLTGLTVPERGGRTMATLKDPSTQALYQAFEGDVVDGRYRVVRIGVESVVVAYLDGSGQRTLPLGG